MEDAFRTLGVAADVRPPPVLAPTGARTEEVARTLRWIAEAARSSAGAERSTCYVTSGLGVITAIETTEADAGRRAYIASFVGTHRDDLPVWTLQVSQPGPMCVIEDVREAPAISRELAARMGLGAFIAVRLQYQALEAGVPPVELGSLFCTYARPRRIPDAVRLEIAALGRLGAMAVANQHLYGQALWALAQAERRAQELAASEARLQGILDSSLDGVVIATELGVIESLNPAAERMFGLRADEARGRQVADLMIPPGTRRHHDDAITRLRGGAPPRTLGRVVEMEAWSAARGAFPVELTLTRIETYDGPRYVAHIRDITERVEGRRRLAMDAREDAALARVATLAAGGGPSSAVLERIAAEANDLLGGVACAVARIGAATLTMTATESPGNPMRGRTLPLSESIVLARVARDHRPARADVESLSHLREARAAAERGWRYLLAVPVRAEAGLWGGIVIGRGAEAGPFNDQDEDRLARFADLASVAIEAAEVRSRLEALATTDALTGLANHRAFHARLGGDLDQCRREGVSLALAILDVDDFKRVNDALGHPRGDVLLTEIARRLRSVANGDGLLARFGGDEFAWLVPGASASDLLPLVGRMIEETRSIEVSFGRLSLSAGIADTWSATSRDGLVDLADGALYWAKQAGRGQAVPYSPEIVTELSASERAARLERSQALTALRALARAVDAKDHSTAEHSERVADMAVALAVEIGWEPEACRRLREAALVHDVGKIGVPDAILLKPDRLTVDEYARVKGHATLGARIVDEVLDPEQVAWVRHHHERWDGSGYPGGLAGIGIPAGSRLIAVADAWDVMRSVRTYSRPRSREEALAECLRVAGVQFDPDAVDALMRVLAGSPPAGA